MSQDQIEEIQRKIEQFDKLHAEHIRFASSVAGGLRVALWGFGILQLILAAGIGWAVSQMSISTERLNSHSTELAVTKLRMEQFLSAPPQFTKEANELSESQLEARIKAWVELQLHKQ